MGQYSTLPPKREKSWDNRDRLIFISFLQTIYPITMMLAVTQWLFDSGSRGRWFEHHRKHSVVPLSKTIQHLLGTGSTQERSWHDWKIVNWDVKKVLMNRCYDPESAAFQFVDSLFSNIIQRWDLNCFQNVEVYVNWRELVISPWIKGGDHTSYLSYV